MGNPLEKTTAQDLMNAAIEAFESLEETFSAVPKVSIPIAEPDGVHNVFSQSQKEGFTVRLRRKRQLEGFKDQYTAGNA